MKLPKFEVMVNLLLSIIASVLFTFGMVSFVTNNAADAIFFIVVAIYVLNIRYPYKFLN